MNKQDNKIAKLNNLLKDELDKELIAKYPYFKIIENFNCEEGNFILIENNENELMHNLTTRDNCDKMDMMGIVTKNYHQTPEYYGNNLNDEDFFENIKKFLKDRL